MEFIDARSGGIAKGIARYTVKTPLHRIDPRRSSLFNRRKRALFDRGAGHGRNVR
jgi:hypothetical protein